MAIKDIIKNSLNYSILDLYNGIRDKRKKERHRIESTKLFMDYLESNDLKCLQIGCGSNLLTGWLNTDISGKSGIGYLDAGEKFPFENDIFDFIFSEHVFEHLTVDQQINLLKEGCRVLKEDGIMRIATPSLDFLFNLYKEPQEENHLEYVRWAIETSPTLQPVNKGVEDRSVHYCYVINNFFKAWGHQMIHNFSSLEKIAMQCGFSAAKLTKVGESEEPVLRGIEMHGTIIPENKNILETIVLELKK